PRPRRTSSAQIHRPECGGDHARKSSPTGYATVSRLPGNKGPPVTCSHRCHESEKTRCAGPCRYGKDPRNGKRRAVRPRSNIRSCALCRLRTRAHRVPLTPSEICGEGSSVASELAVGDRVWTCGLGAKTFDLVPLVGIEVAFEPEPVRIPFPGEDV